MGHWDFPGKYPDFGGVSRCPPAHTPKIRGFTTAIHEETSWTESTLKDEKRTYFQDSL
jgi:hypothetical protein